MDNKILSYLPMSETAYYILLSLKHKRHGYGIMQDVEVLTKGRIKLGAGTLYGSLSKMEKENLIKAVAEEDRKKLYVITDLGTQVIEAEVKRLGELYEDGKKLLEDSI